MYRLIFLALLLTNPSSGSTCENYVMGGAINRGGFKRDVNPILDKYVKTFESRWGNKIKFRVMFNNLNNNIAGVCKRWYNGARLVEIDIIYFFNASESQKEQLVYHELGHCALFRDHDNSRVVFRDDPGVRFPYSVMNDVAFSISEIIAYDKYKKHYMVELFKND